MDLRVLGAMQERRGKKKETYLGSVCLWYVVNWSTALTGL